MADEKVDYGRNVVPFMPGNLPSFGDRSSGGGGDDGMEARIAKLEADVGYVKTRVDEAASNIRATGDKVGALGTEFAVLTEKAKHFATKSYSIATAVGIVGALSAVIVFADRLKSLLSLG
jgi:hypothetical protein